MVMIPDEPVDPGQAPEPLEEPRRTRRNANAPAAPAACPPGQSMINGRCRHAGDNPCGPGQCKDVVTGQCRSFNARREKINETDVAERSTGGGRGFCKQMEGGGRGGGRGGGASLGAEQQYFDRLVAAGDWTEWPPGSGNYFNDPGNDRSKRVWVNRGNLQLDQTGKGYVSTHDPTKGPAGSGGSGPGGPGGIGGANPASVPGLIQDTFTKILGGQTRFSPEVMADITAGAKGRQQAEVSSGQEALDEDLARRGLSSSPVGAGLARDVASDAAGRFDTTMQETRVKKAMFDFEDKMQGLKAAQDYLNEMHDYELGLDANSIQREQIAASLTLGRERIAADAKNLLAQLASNEGMASMQIGSTEFMFMQRQLQCMMNPAAC